MFSKKAALWVFLAGLAFALAAFVCSYLFLKDAVGDWRGMLVAAPLTAFFCGLVCWGVFIVRGQKAGFWRGAWVGVLVALLSHPLAWYGSILYFYLAGVPRTLNLFEGILASLFYGLVSLIFVGWLTLPAGAVVGSLLAYAQTRWG
ncbi:MAG: hypothetical protein Fur0044_55020 [Anaerolineae bacterium]|nr:hypothetical protein [Anaerolineales bacterium]MCK6624973.1 hypothetical protein [Anaerolineae bacterium]MCQ3979408.1 hypothetical protein [Anaerolineae bacterium]